MSDTYTQLYIQLVFAVKGRNNFVQSAWEQGLYKYITAAVQNDKHKILVINGMADHTYIFWGLHPAFAISDLVKDIKRASNNWMMIKDFLKVNLNGSLDTVHFRTENHKLTMCANTF